MTVTKGHAAQQHRPHRHARLEDEARSALLREVRLQPGAHVRLLNTIGRKSILPQPRPPLLDRDLHMRPDSITWSLTFMLHSTQCSKLHADRCKGCAARNTSSCCGLSAGKPVRALLVAVGSVLLTACQPLCD